MYFLYIFYIKARQLTHKLTLADVETFTDDIRAPLRKWLGEFCRTLAGEKRGALSEITSGENREHYIDRISFFLERKFEQAYSARGFPKLSVVRELYLSEIVPAMLISIVSLGYFFVNSYISI